MFKRSRSYREVNTLRLGYKKPSINIFLDKRRLFFSDNYKTYECNLREEGKNFLC